MNFTNYKTIDYETKNEKLAKLALNPYDEHTEIFSYCIGHHTGEVEVNRLDNEDESLNKKNWERLIDFWEDTTTEKIAHNAKFEISINRMNGVPMPKGTIVHDTMILDQLLRNLAISHGLANLCWELRDPQYYYYRGLKLNSRELDQYVKNEGIALNGYQNIEKKLFNIYQIADGQRPMLLFMLEFPIVYENKKLFRDYINELDLIVVTQKMEQDGLQIDRNQCYHLINWLENELDQSQHDTYKLLGRFVNLNSTQQLARLLFSDLNFPVVAFTKNKQPSVDKDVIMYLRETFPGLAIFDLVLKYRSYTKGLANIKSYLDFATKDDIIHPNLLTNRATTGRGASNNPNLLNVEKKDALKNPFPVPARKCFCCKPGYVMYFIDQSAIELKLIVEAAQCKSMMERMKNGENPHVIFCNHIFGEHLPIEKRFISKKESKDLYNGGKNGHFCICFGGSLGKMANEMNLTVEEAEPGYQLYREEFPEIVKLVQKGKEKISETGYVITPFGRKLFIPMDKIYAWLNFYIQGTAAGIIKRGQVAIFKYICDHWKNSGIHINLQVYDEIIISVPRHLQKYRHEFLPVFGQLMTNIDEIKTPLDVEYKMSRTNWDSAREIIV